MTNPMDALIEALDSFEAMLVAIYAVDGDAFHQAIIAFVRDLEARHPDIGMVLLYYVLVGTTPPPYLSRYDLTGRDSIARFVYRYYQKTAALSNTDNADRAQSDDIAKPDGFDVTKTVDALLEFRLTGRNGNNSGGNRLA